MATGEGSRHTERPQGSSDTQMGQNVNSSELHASMPRLPLVTNSALESFLQSLSAQVVQVVQDTVIQTLSQQRQEEKDDMSSNLIKIAKMNPPSFEGSMSPAGDIVDWLTEIDNLLTTFACPEKHRVAIAAHYLKKSAREWWEACKPSDHDPTWDEFKAKMESRYYPRVLRREEKMKMFRPRPEGETVDEAAKLFYRILRMNPSVAENEISKITIFEVRMSDEIRKYMPVPSCETLEELVVEALNVEASLDAVYGRDRSNKRRKTG